MNNYLSDLGDYGIAIWTGVANSSYPPSITQSRFTFTNDHERHYELGLYSTVPSENVIAFNTIVNGGKDAIVMHQPGETYHNMGRNNVVANNLIACRRNEPHPCRFIRTTFTEPNLITGNIIYGSAGGHVPGHGMTEMDPELELKVDGVWRPSQTTPIRGRAVEIPERSVQKIVGIEGTALSHGVDIDGQARGQAKDVGSDQFSVEAVLWRPLSKADLGQTIGPGWKKN